MIYVCVSGTRPWLPLAWSEHGGTHETDLEDVRFGAVSASDGVLWEGQLTDPIPFFRELFLQSVLASGA